MKTQHIIPAIIPDSFMHLESKLDDLRGVVRRVQIDVMDNSYAPAVSWPYDKTDKNNFEFDIVKDGGLPGWQDFDFEIDLMVANPEEKISEWSLSGAKCIIFHVESTNNLDEIFRQCAGSRVEVALALKPSTDIGVLSSYINDAVFVQVMGSDTIGRHGVGLSDKAVEMVRNIKSEWKNVTVGVDIGVNAETVPKLCEAGATRFASGSAVFNYGSPVGSLVHLESVVSKCLVG
jgi:ribulose-phosphate 3-epimerase